MDATTWAAWVGAVGSVANALALVVVERRKSQPDVSVKAAYRPAADGDPAGVWIVVHAGEDTIITAAGLARPGRFWRRRRTVLRGHARQAIPGGLMAGVARALPVTVQSAGWMQVLLTRKAAVESGLDPAATYTAWVATGGGRLLRAADVFTLEPE
jgi:hypothetical protein